MHSTAHEVRTLENGHVIAVDPVLDGRGQRRITAGHRTLPPANSETPREDRPDAARAGDVVALRPLTFYDAGGKSLTARDAVASGTFMWKPTATSIARECPLASERPTVPPG
jgi:hypothetical protein